MSLRLAGRPAATKHPHNSVVHPAAGPLTAAGQATVPVRGRRSRPRRGLAAEPRYRLERMPVVPSPRHLGLFRALPREVAILSSVSFTVALGYGIVAPGIPAFARQFGVSTAAAASVISAFALMRIIGALPSGRLADRLGERKMIAIGIAVVAVSSVLAGFSDSFVQLIVLRGVGG